MVVNYGINHITYLIQQVRACSCFVICTVHGEIHLERILVIDTLEELSPPRGKYYEFCV